jgi:hypothetical protein
MTNNGIINNANTINNQGSIIGGNLSSNYIYNTTSTSLINNQGGIIELSSSIYIDSQIILNGGGSGGGVIYNFNAGEISGGTIGNVNGVIYNGDALLTCGIQGIITSFVTGTAVIDACPP